MRPLEGVRVVDATSYLTGPLCTVMLADLGADVVKVERPPKGDPLRRIGHRFMGVSAQFANINRNKRSIAVDLRVDDEVGALRELLTTADVFVQNWRPGVADGLGLSDETLAASNPRLVRVSITGYGHDGPRSAAPAFDAILQGETGLAHRQARDGVPEPVRTYLADKVTGVMAAQAVLAALLTRERTGRGERVDVSMLDAVAYFNFPDMMERRTFLDDPAADEPVPEPASFVVAASDGHLVIAPASGAQVQAALAVVGRPDDADRLRGLGATELFTELMALIEAATRRGPCDMWLERFAAADVPVGRVASLDDHLADPQVRHNGTYMLLRHERLGVHRVPAYPACFGGRRVDPPQQSFPDVGAESGQFDSQAPERVWRSVSGN